MSVNSNAACATVACRWGCSVQRRGSVVYLAAAEGRDMTGARPNAG